MDSSIDEEFAVDFSGYEPEEVLQALHDTAKPVNDFYYRYGSLQLEVAKAVLDTRTYIDYIGYGRYLKVDFKHFPLIDPGQYDDLHGGGAMEKALDMLYKRAEYRN